MRLLPRSIFGWLLGSATLTTTPALAFAAVAIGHVLERFVTRGLDQQLDAQVLALARAVRADGRLATARAISLPAFGEPGSGWGLGWGWGWAGLGWRSTPFADAPSSDDALSHDLAQGVRR